MPLSIWIFVCPHLEDADNTVLDGMIINGCQIAYGKIENAFSFKVTGQGQGHHNLKNKFVTFNWIRQKTACSAKVGCKMLKNLPFTFILCTQKLKKFFKGEFWQVIDVHALIMYSKSFKVPVIMCADDAGSNPKHQK